MRSRIVCCLTLIIHFLVAETANVAVAFACAHTLASHESACAKANKSNIWCVGVGVANGLSGAEIVRMILDQSKTFKYLRRTPNVEGKVLVLKLNKLSKEVVAGFATCAIWLGPSGKSGLESGHHGQMRSAPIV